MTWEHRCGAASWRDGALVVGVGLLHHPSRAVDLHGEAISGRCAVLREITTATQLAARRGAATLSEYGGNNRVPSSSMPSPCIDSGNTVAVPSRACRPCESRYNWVLRQLCEDLYGNLGGQANMMPSQSTGASSGRFYSDFYLPGSEHMECTNTGYILQLGCIMHGIFPVCVNIPALGLKRPCRGAASRPQLVAAARSTMAIREDGGVNTAGAARRRGRGDSCDGLETTADCGSKISGLAA